MRAAVEPYVTHSSQASMMRDFNVVMNEVETFDEREVIRQLTEDSFPRRVDVLERLRAAVRVHQHLPFSNTIGLFQGLDHALSDTNWDVRRQCITLIADYIPHLRSDVDACMSLVLPRLIFNIGDNRIVIRRTVIQALHTYMKYTADMPLLMRYYIQCGFENTDPKIRKESTVSLPLLVTSDFVSEDFTDIIASLCKKLVDRDEDENIQNLALVSLNKLRVSTGDPKFKSYLMKLQTQLRDYYCKLANFPLDSDPPISPTQQFYNGDLSRTNSQTVPELYFGVVPAQVRNQLSDDNFRNRGQAVEQLKMILENLHSIAPLMPHIKEFLNMLNDLLDDNNFRIITVTLDIMGILVEKTSQEIRPHLKPVLQILTKRMGDNKNVIRQAITKVITQLMQILGPKLVLLLLCDNLSHRTVRVRAEAINCIINALLTFPSYEFDLASLCSSMAYCLLDSKRSVRHACLECFAVLAQCLGAGKQQPLISAVDNLEQMYGSDSEGVMEAVQARLQRRVLPRRNEDNLIEYAVQLPSLNASRNGSFGQQGADIDWILAGSGAGGTSARSMRLEDLESTSRQSSASLDGRRHLSAGKKPKLPWDESQSPKGSDSPVKPKQTWADEPSGDVPKKSISKASRQREDMLLASVNYNGSTDAFGDSLPTDGSSHPSTTSLSTTKKPSAPFSKSEKQLKHSQKEGSVSEISGQISKSISGKPLLNPLPVGEGSAAATAAAAALAHSTWSYETAATPGKGTPPSSIPIKAAPINLKSGAKKPGKVPPIPKSQSPVTTGDDIVEVSGELPQLNASLNKIRNSATKKKADKLFEKLEKQESAADLNPSSSISKSPSLKADNPFETKAKLARHNSQAKSKSYTELANEKLASAEKIPAVQPLSHYNSSELRSVKSDSLASKIRQSANRNSLSSTPNTAASGADGDQMVAVVGRGYSEDSIETPPKQAAVKRRRPPQKAGTGSSLSPLGLAASSAPGMIPIDDDADMVTVIGKGMFEGDMGKRERSNSMNKRADRSNSISKSMSSGYGTLKDQTIEFGESDEEMDSLQMSKGLKERADQKKKEKQEEVAAARRKAMQEKEKEEATRLAEAQRRLEQEQEQLRKRKEQQEAAAAAAEKRRRDLTEQRKHEADIEAFRIAGNSASSASFEGGGGRATSPAPSSASSLQHSITSSYESLRPFSKPALAFKEAMKLIADDDWSNKMDAITRIRRLTHFHPDVLQSSVHAVTLAMLAEVKNLRSQVARLAIIGLGDMFSILKKSMDPELDTCSKVLLPKNSEANEFIRSELDKTLCAMAADTTPQKCLAAFIIGGAQHKNQAARKATVQHMVTLCNRLGPGKLLSGVKDLTDKVLVAVASLSTDASPETRWNAKMILTIMMVHPDFEAMLTKHTSSKVAREVLQIVENLKIKGLGDMPSDTPSAKGARRSGTMNRGSRTNSAESTDSVANSVKSRRSVVGAQASEEASILVNKMVSTQWSLRHESVSELLEMVQTKPRAVSAHAIKIFDKYALLIKDSNSKVALHALGTLHILLPQVKHDIQQASANILIQNTASGLASKNKEIYEAASNLLDSFINNIDHPILFVPFVQVAMNATAKTKPDIVDRVAYLSKKVYKFKPKQVTLHGLPLAWNLVKSIAATGCTTALKGSVTDYIVQLHEMFGSSLYDLCLSSPGSTPQLVAKVKELSQQKSES